MAGDKKENILNDRGFTLLELMVSIAIFGTIMTSVTMIFQNIVKAQQISIAQKNTQENLSYVMEIMSKELRQAKSGDQAGVHDCAGMTDILGRDLPLPLPPSYKIYNSYYYAFSTDVSSPVLYFKNKFDQCVAYYVSFGILYIARDDFPPDLPPDYNLPVTPDEIVISNFDITIDDDLLGVGTTKQPKISVRMTAEGINHRTSNVQSLDIQTTISARYYEGS